MATAIYIRVSTEMQEKEGISLETQKEQLKAYCMFKGLDNVIEYVDVGSARTTNRTDFLKMMDEVEKGYINNVVVLKLDRLTRSIIDLNNLMIKLNELDCALHSATENIDTTTATGRMIINLIGTFAQWESETISERVSVNMMTLAERGIWQSAVPYGFSLGKDKRLKVKEDEANILREAFDMIKNGYSFNHTEKYISNKYNLKWRDNYLRRKIRNESLIGNIERNGKIITETHEGIITKTERQQLLLRLEENRSGRTSSIEHNDIFRRKIKCYQCDNNLALATNHKSDKGYFYYYRCNNCHKKGQGTISVAESKILKALNDYFKNIEVDDIDTAEIDNKKPKTSLKRRLIAIQNERDRIQRAWIKNLMSDTDLERYQLELDDEQIIIEDELSKQDVKTITKEELEKIIITLQDSFSDLSREEKRSFVQQFIKYIQFNRTLVEGYKKKYDIEITNVEFY